VIIGRVAVKDSPARPSPLQIGNQLFALFASNRKNCQREVRRLRAVGQKIKKRLIRKNPKRLVRRSARLNGAGELFEIGREIVGQKRATTARQIERSAGGRFD